MSVLTIWPTLARAEGPVLTFVQNGAPIATQTEDGVEVLTLDATPFDIVFSEDLFRTQTSDGIYLSLGSEEVLRPLIQDCQGRMDGPFFEGLNRFAINPTGLSMLFADAPSERSQNVGWHGVNPSEAVDPDGVTFRITSILDLQNDRAEALIPGSELFLIAYDPPRTLFFDSCSAPDGADTSAGVIDARYMSFYTLRFE